MIQNPAKLNLSKGQLRLENEQGEFTLPIEDITALILESPQIMLSSSLLSACQEQGVAIITCDKTHTPNGILLPFQPHSRQSRVARIQQSWSEPLRKRLWQRIVQNKIRNQATCLEQCASKEEARPIYAMASRVQSGDPENIEAQAARAYWPRLMGKDFKRGNSDLINAALNYGYAVVRACVARSQVAHGLIPAFGIHHDNDLNAFNLTDDVMEVFRPFVDREVTRMKQEGLLEPDASTLSVAIRQRLADISNNLCLLDGNKHKLINASDAMAASLVGAIEGKNATALTLPELLQKGDKT